MIAKISKVLFFLVFLLSIFVVRSYNVQNQPPGLHIDEVSFGVDAKSVVESGLDTWGERLPLYFKAYGEYKAPGQAYFMALIYALRGQMDTLTTRLPNVIFGLGMLFIMMFSVKLFWPKISSLVIILSLLLLGLSPWHFALSRVFYESYGGAFWIAFSIFGTLLSWRSKKYQNLGWLITVLGSIFAGYWYPSLRYVAIGGMVWAIVMTPNGQSKTKKFTVAILLTLILGFGWVRELASSAGLSRLHFYNTSVTTGQTLSIDEKRQFCYLSFNRDSERTKWCYLLWNKPLDRFITTTRTYVEYLGTTFLFINSGGDYGTDKAYGAYHLTALPLYLLGILAILRSLYSSLLALKAKKQIDNYSRVVFYVSGLLLLALFPAATTGGVALHLVSSALYILMLIFILGLKLCWDYVEPLYPRALNILVIILIILTLGLSAQSITHYYAVFTHSNDIMWTSDTEEVFKYIKQNSSKYDLIIDTALHGPQAGYFYGDITTEVLQNTKKHSEPDSFGFAYLIHAGKYLWIQSGTLDIIACSYRNDNINALIISNPQDKVNTKPIYTTYTWNKVHKMRELYDLRDVLKALSLTKGGINEYCSQYDL
ncbi:MAG: hypothetical protein Fur0011_7450 [Candidatus Microgenomates bacterium]